MFKHSKITKGGLVFIDLTSIKELHFSKFSPLTEGGTPGFREGYPQIFDSGGDFKFRGGISNPEGYPPRPDFYKKF